MAAINALIARGTQAPNWGILDSKQRALNTIGAEKGLQYGMEDRAYQMEQRPMVEAMQKIELLKAHIPMVNSTNYKQVREGLISKYGVPENLLPPVEQLIQGAAEAKIPFPEYLEKMKQEFAGQLDRAGSQYGSVKSGQVGDKRAFVRLDKQAKKMVEVPGAVPRMTEAELQNRQTGTALPELQAQAQADPNAFWEAGHGYRMNDDGSLYVDPVTGMPRQLKNPTEYLGKRGNLKAIQIMGELRDDSQELLDLLELPRVKESFKQIQADGGLWDQTKGKFNNKIWKWLQQNGISRDSATGTVIARIQRLASDERKRFLGTAVTPTELHSVLTWMPDAGDSFETIMVKTNLMAHESNQEFRRWLNVVDDYADVSEYYKTFGIKRFGYKEPTAPGMGGGVPEGIPEGSKNIGPNANGETVWQDPEGNQWVE